MMRVSFGWRYWLLGSLVVTTLLGCVPLTNTSYAVDFLNDFAKPLLNGGEDIKEKPFDWGISDDAGLLENLRKIFYPATDQGTWGVIWRALRIIGIGLLIALLIWAGARFILDAGDPDKLKDDKMNVLYILLGAVLFFSATWLLGTALDFGSISGLTDGDNSALEQVENKLVVIVIGFLKAAAFFVAIMFLVYYGYRMMNSFDREERLSNAKTGILNVIMALVFIKIIDYLYYIAQTSDFKSKAIQFVVEASKLMWWIFGIFMVLVLFYAGYMYVTSSGSESRIQSAGNTVKTALVVVLMILLFLLIVYQVFQDLLA